MVNQSDPSHESRLLPRDGHGRAPMPVHDRIAARALRSGVPGLARTAREWSAQAEDGLCRRMFRDASPAGPTRDVPIPTMS